MTCSITLESSHKVITSNISK